MQKKNVNKLSLGLYVIYWKSGGYSLASVGMDREGNRWVAPINWTGHGDKPGGGSERRIWKWVKKAKLIVDHNNVEKLL